MANTLRYTLIVILLFLYSNYSHASHAAGMDITYECISQGPGTNNDTYRVTVKFYRDCSGQSAPLWMRLSVFNSCNNRQYSSWMNRLPNPQEITPICPSYITTCQDLNALITGIEEYTYQTTITLPARCSDWVLSARVVNRNPNIATILLPNTQALYIEAVINNTSAISACNNSPTFSVLPVPFICAGMTYCYNNGAIDIDGDSLVYELTTPLSNNGTAINYQNPYSVNNPAGGTTSFDPITGNLCITCLLYTSDAADE